MAGTHRGSRFGRSDRRAGGSSGGGRFTAYGIILGLGILMAAATALDLPALGRATDPPRDFAAVPGPAVPGLHADLPLGPVPPGPAAPPGEEGGSAASVRRRTLPPGRRRAEPGMADTTTVTATATPKRSPLRADEKSRTSWLTTRLEDERILGYVLLLPAFLLIIVFIAYPFALGVWMSLTDKVVGQPGNFVGLANFVKLLGSDIFRTAAWNTVFFTVVATAIKAALGMWLAVLLNRKFRLSRFTRAAVLLPFIVPTVLSTLVWLWMLDGTFSVFNWILRWFWNLEVSVFGLVLKEDLGYIRGPNWLGDPTLAMGSIIMANVWRGLPFFAISFLAALQTVPTELYDAAEIDGASGWRKFWHVTLPMIKPVAIVVVVFSFVVTFADFQLVYVLTRGGPHNSTHLLATLAYQLSMHAGNLGEGAATALFMVPLLLVVIVLQLTYLRRIGVD